MNTQRHALFLSHGGGPMPLLGEAGHADLVACLQNIAATLPRPSAIIVVSAHWEAETPTVTTGATPGLIYDYHGFPPESYAIRYPCPGNPPLASAIIAQLEKAGIPARADQARGLDHGVFVPLKIMYPNADIPCVQVSLLSSLDPQAHVELGRALQAVADPSVLLIGSGFSFHNMRAFFTPETPDARQANLAFEQWLLNTCSNRDLSEAERAERLIHWEAAPAARYCHPREEHLLPLQVCYGFAASACTAAFQVQVLGKAASMYVWGA